MDKSLTQLICSVLVVLLANALMPAQDFRSIGKRAVLIKGTTFEMGIADKDVPELMRKFSVSRPELFREAGPKHRVTIGDYYLNKTRLNYGKRGFGRAIEVGRYAPDGYALYDDVGNV